MKKERPSPTPLKKSVGRPTSALTPEQMGEMAYEIFLGHGHQEGRATANWPEAEMKLLSGPPANRRAL